MTEHVTIRYDIPKIFACRQVNNVFPKELKDYCVHGYRTTKSPHEQILVKIMTDITNSLTIGVNPNDTTMMNVIRGELNKINNINYNDVLHVLKGLNYTCENHFAMLANELVLKSMNDVLAVKGFESNKNQISPSEIYVNVCLEFSELYIEDSDNSILFLKVLVKICHKHFHDFTDSLLKMDQNNQHRVNNYKGFMNMIGLLYVNKCFHQDIVIKCFDKITRIITESTLPQEELDNYYSGYERLMNQVMNRFEKLETEDQIQEEEGEFEQLLPHIVRNNKKITEKKNAEAKDRPSTARKSFSMMIHLQNINRFESLCKKMHKTLTNKN